MKNLFKMYRDWRNRKFVEKIDKLYFHKDKQGNRFMKGTLLVVYDNKTGAYGNVMACLEEDLDKTLSKVTRFSHYMYRMKTTSNKLITNIL